MEVSETMLERREYARQYYRKNRARDKEKRLLLSKEWQRKNPDKIYAYSKKYIQEHMKNYMANQKVYKAVKSGTMIRPNQCSKCGKECKPDGHHEDYDKPLDVIWLCRECHMKTRV